MENSTEVFGSYVKLWKNKIMKLKDFVTAAVNGNRELRNIGLSSISDFEIKSNALKMGLTMVGRGLTVGQYIEECRRRKDKK